MEYDNHRSSESTSTGLPIGFRILERSGNIPNMPTVSTASTASITTTTYTTAGTLYNPSAPSLPPPARRSRFNPGRYAAPLTPNVAILRDLEGRHCRPRDASGRHTPPYSPLQQNYDRAVSPVRQQITRAPDQRVIMPPMPPHMRSFDGPRVDTGNHADADLGVAGKTADDASSSSSSDSLSMFQGLTVKSLSNLASYPNPTQHRAQKALQRARLAHGTLTPAADRSGDSTFPPGVIRTPESFGDFTGSPSMLRASHIDPVGLDRVTAGLQLRGERYLPHQPVRSGSVRDPYAAPTHGANGQLPSNNASNTTLSSGPGAPPPLTAGPPGQRQYRPSTFESTIKALHGVPQPPPPPTETSEEEREFASLRAHFSKVRQEGLQTINFHVESRDATPAQAPSQASWTSTPSRENRIAPATSTDSIPASASAAPRSQPTWAAIASLDHQAMLAPPAEPIPSSASVAPKPRPSQGPISGLEDRGVPAPGAAPIPSSTPVALRPQPSLAPIPNFDNRPVPAPPAAPATGLRASWASNISFDNRVAPALPAGPIPVSASVAPRPQAPPARVLPDLISMEDKIYDTLSREEIAKYYPNGGPRTYYKPMAEQPKIRLAGPRFKPGQWKMTEEQIAARNQEISSMFFGSARLGLSIQETEQAVKAEVARLCFERVVGAKIDRRGMRNTKVIYPHLSTSIASRTSTNELVAPLLNLVYGTLLYHRLTIDAGLSIQFTKVPEAAEGSNAFKFGRHGAVTTQTG